ncbi:hypothetical protein [Actinoplanes nipponensis]|uniref:hypothetical protein n=1 Tax=Actinoplanes nipponensis TaxID=135950 RepID=UPI00194122F7|nr:hypothetical protein [Actinoplanes nipponensis]
MIRNGLTRRAELSRGDAGEHPDDATRAEPPAPVVRPLPPESLAAEPWADRDEPGLDDEHPDDEVRDPRRRGRLSRLDGRTRTILAAAAIAAALVNAAAVWAYWHIAGSEIAPAGADAYVELHLLGRSDLDRPLTPGRRGNLTVTVTNDHDFPIRITAVRAAPGTVVADDEHRENGCLDGGVTVARPAFQVRWDVARNNVAAFTVPDGLTMAAAAQPACAGAAFTVPVLVSGTAGSS